MSPFPVPLSELVIITCVDDPNNFFIQTYENAEKCRQLSKKLSNFPLISAEKLQIGNLYLYLNDDEEERFRCVIIERETGLLLVHLVDIGELRIVSVKEIYTLKEDDQQSQTIPLCQQCALNNLYPRINVGWDDSAISLFTDLISDRRCIMDIKGESSQGILEVELFTDYFDNGDLVSVSDMMVQLGEASLSPPGFLITEFIPEVPEYDDYLQIGLSLHAKICHVESPERFFIYPIEATEMKHKMCKKIYKCAKYLRQICSARFCDPVIVKNRSDENFYYRGIIEDLPGGRIAQILSVDYGFREITDYRNIFTLFPYFLNTERLGGICALYNIRPKIPKRGWSPESIEYLKSFTSYLAYVVEKDEENSIFKIHLLGKYPDSNIKDYVSINQKLVKKNYAQFIDKNLDVYPPGFHRKKSEKKRKKLDSAK